MKTKKNEELQSRREFFKKAAKGALPILGAIALSNLPFLSKAAEKSPMGCQYGCQYNCSGSCVGGCYNHCNDGCTYACMTDCSGSCTGSCYNSCYTTCAGTCQGVNNAGWSF